MDKVFNISPTNTSLKDISQKGNELVLALKLISMEAHMLDNGKMA